MTYFPIDHKFLKDRNSVLSTFVSTTYHTAWQILNRTDIGREGVDLAIYSSEKLGSDSIRSERLFW